MNKFTLIRIKLKFKIKIKRKNRYFVMQFLTIRLRNFILCIFYKIKLQTKTFCKTKLNNLIKIILRLS